MKKYFLLFFIIIGSISQSFSAEQSVRAIALLGDIMPSKRIRSLVEPITVAQTETSLNIQVYIDINLKIQILNGDEIVVYEEINNNALDQEFIIRTKNFKEGNYTIILVNEDNGETATGSFQL